MSYDVSLVTSGHDVADARLHRIVAALVRAGAQVEVLGLGDAGGGPSGAAVRTWARPSIPARATLAARMARAATGRVLVALDPDSLLAITAVGALRRVPVVADVHEDYARLLSDRAWASRWGGALGIGAQGVVAAFTTAAARADLTLVADEHVPPPSARQRVVLRNLPDLAMLPAPAEPEASPRAIYVGDLRASRGLFAMVEAIRRAPDWSVDLVGPVAAGDRHRLDALLAQDGLARRVRLHGRLAPEQAWRLSAGAWAGFLLLTDTPAFRDAVPSKLYEYAATGLPVIATDLPRTAELVRACGIGVVVPGGVDERVGAAAAEVLRRWSADRSAYEAVRTQTLGGARRMLPTGASYDEVALQVLGLVGASASTLASASTPVSTPRSESAPATGSAEAEASASASVSVSASGAARGRLGRVRSLLPDDAKDLVREGRRRLPIPAANLLDRAMGHRAPSDADAVVSATLAARPEPGRSAEIRLLVGPANFAGQGDAWTKALRAHPADGSGPLAVTSMAVSGPIPFPVDYRVPTTAYRSLRWQRDHLAWVTSTFTHALIEAERPLTGTLYGASCAGELPVLREAGLRLGFISHGSDIRLPSRHAAHFPDSPFADAADARTAGLERQAIRNQAILRAAHEAGDPVFVSTPDLLDDAPYATWCPTVVDLDAWAPAPDAPEVLTRELPVVVHIPSNPQLKGSALVEPVLRGLEADGVLEYRALTGVTRAELIDQVKHADIVLDQFVMGLYGVAALEALAAGRIAVGFVGETVRDRVRAATGHEVPIVEATPQTVRAVLLELITHPERTRLIAAAGPHFVSAVHDGRYSAQVLRKVVDPQRG